MRYWTRRTEMTLPTPGSEEKTVKVWKVVLLMLRYPRYTVLLCADSCLPPSPWCSDFRVEIDRKHRVIRLVGDFE